GRSAAIELSVNDCASQRFDRPGLRAKRHGIEVAGKADRQFMTCTPDMGDQLRAAFAEWAQFNRKTRILEQTREFLGTGALGARRIDRVESDEILGQFDR